MKKILFVSHDATFSGAPLVLFEILKRLHKTNRFYLKVLFLQGGDKLEDFKQVCDVKVIEKPENTALNKVKRRIFGNSNKLVKKLNKENFDLLYINSMASYVLFPDLDFLKSKRTILHMHESGNFPFYSYEVFNKIVKKADKIICVSNLVKNYLLSTLEVDLKKVQVVYPYYFNLGDLIDVENNLENKDIFTIGGCGNYSLTKGIDLFVSVASNFFKSYGVNPPVRFLWLGDDGYKEAKYLINQDINRLGLRDRITILPKTNAPLKVFKKFDLFFLSSREEAFGLAAFENGMLGNPIICFENSSGISELIESENSIVPYMNIDSVTKLIWEMYNDKKKFELERKKTKINFSAILKNDNLKMIDELIVELI